MQCHRCQHNGHPTEACLTCTDPNKRIDIECRCRRTYIENVDKAQDGYEAIEQSEQQDQPTATGLDEEVEDRLRKILCTLTQLDMFELLLVQSIMQGNSLTDFSKKIEDMLKTTKSFTRFRAFQTRKRILEKLPHFKNLLLTSGQRKELKR